MPLARTSPIVNGGERLREQASCGNLGAMTSLPALRLLPAIAVCLLLSACATREPVNQSAMITIPQQCSLPALAAEVPDTRPVAYEVLEARCGAEAWCAAWQLPQHHSLVYAQTFSQCVGRSMPVRAPAVLVQPGAAPSALPAPRPAPPPMNPPRP